MQMNNRISKIKNNHMNVAVLKKFIEAYKNETSLWKTKSKEYADRNLKKNAYNKIVSILKDEGFEDANKDFVVRKINVLRCCWRKEYNKVLKTNFKYKPNLWYYNLLQFIVDGNDSSTSKNFYNRNSKDNLVKSEKMEDIFKKKNEAQNENTEKYANLDENQIEIIWEKDSEKEFSSNSNNIDINEDITSFIETPRQHFSSEKERSDKVCILQHNNNSQTISKCNSDEYDAFGFIVASKLRKIASKNELQQILCENIINSALLGAILGKLSEDSSLSF